MKIHDIAFIVALMLSQNLFSQAPDTLWTKTIGGNLSDVGNSVKQTIDSGFVIAGITKSFGAGGEDIYLIRTDKNGDVLWAKTFGGSNNDKAYTVHQTDDNGFIIIGTTASFGNGQDDFILWKTDSLGNTEWFKTYGNSANERGFDGEQTLDGGYIIVGDSSGQSTNTWIIKTDSAGNILWSKSIGFNSSSYPSYYGYSIQQTNDSGYVICGTVMTFEYPSGYRYNYFLAKFTADGIPLFLKTYENNGFDWGSEVRETNSGNLILAGTTGSPSYSWCWLIKVNPLGNMIWNKTVVGSQISVQFTSFEITSDSGFIITVLSTPGTPAVPDVQLLKTDKDGILSWEKMIGGSLEDRAISVHQTSDAGYIVTGGTKSFGFGDYDIWLLKLDNKPLAQLIVDSPNGGELWTVEDTVDILWTGLNIDNIKIQISVDNGSNWTSIVDSTPNSGIYTWIVSSNTSSDQCLVKISDYSENSIFDISDSVFTIDIINDIGNHNNHNIITEFLLLQNYPNPFNPSTKIRYEIPGHARNDNMLVTLKVYDVLGNEVTTLVNEEKPAGSYEVEFDGSNLTSGVYFYRLIAGSYTLTKKMILLR